jgi:hypothetical protein
LSCGLKLKLHQLFVMTPILISTFSWEHSISMFCFLLHSMFDILILHCKLLSITQRFGEEIF